MNTKAHQVGVVGSSTMEKPMQAHRAFDVHTAVGQLGESIAELHGFLNELQVRLEPVTRPPMPTDNPDEMPVGYSTPLADRISRDAYEVRIATLKVRDILDRLEV